MSVSQDIEIEIYDEQNGLKKNNISIKSIVNHEKLQTYLYMKGYTEELELSDKFEFQSEIDNIE